MYQNHFCYDSRNERQDVIFDCDYDNKYILIFIIYYVLILKFTFWQSYSSWTCSFVTS